MIASDALAGLEVIFLSESVYDFGYFFKQNKTLSNTIKLRPNVRVGN